jgi:hypothetical protein
MNIRLLILNLTDDCSSLMSRVNGCIRQAYGTARAIERLATYRPWKKSKIKMRCLQTSNQARFSGNGGNTGSVRRPRRSVFRGPSASDGVTLRDNHSLLHLNPTGGVAGQYHSLSLRLKICTCTVPVSVHGAQLNLVR